MQVTGTTISSVLVPDVIGPSTAGQVQYHVVDQAGNPMSGQAVQIVAPSLTPADLTGTTGPNGDFVFNYTSPATTGAYMITGNIGGQSDTQTLQVQTTSTVPVVPAGITPSASISANPSVVAVNPAGSESNRSEIRVLFLGANNLPVPNVRVKFDLNGDANSIGGNSRREYRALQRRERPRHHGLLSWLAVEPDKRRHGSCLLRPERRDANLLSVARRSL